jgi:hypothetical protein
LATLQLLKVPQSSIHTRPRQKRSKTDDKPENYFAVIAWVIDLGLTEIGHFDRNGEPHELLLKPLLDLMPRNRAIHQKPQPRPQSKQGGHNKKTTASPVQRSVDNVTGNSTHPCSIPLL